MNGSLGMKQGVRTLRLLVYGLALLIAISPYHAFAADFVKLRQQFNFNRDWRFVPGDPDGAEAPGFDDSKWESVGLPHSFSVPYFLSSEFYVGYGWYRKHFRVPRGSADRRLFVEFEGAFQVAEVFVNGEQIGSHQGGYTGFSLDITRAIHLGSDNVIAVRVNNLWNPRIAPRAGEHVFSGGLYRDVHLVVTAPLHVSWYGTFVRTPSVSREAATVRIDSEIANSAAGAKRLHVLSAIVDPKGVVVATLRSDAETIGAGETRTVTQTSPTIAAPQLWSPTTPALYTLRTTVFDGDRAVDQYETPFGIRRIEWTADRGFFLNGEHVYLRGANVHQDHAGWGDAVTNAGIARDVHLVKDAGLNFIRGSHYPHDPAFAEACDRSGILFWSENAFWGTAPGPKPEGYWNASAYPTVEADRPAFDASVEQQLGEMIRIFRNHPSIVAWSMCNEVFFTARDTGGGMRELLRKCVALTHKLDPTRPAAIGGAQRPLNTGRIDLLGDVAGYNGDGATIKLFQNPGIPNVVSEYDSVSAVRPGAYDPNWGDLGSVNGEEVYAWRSGQVIWCAFDHGSIFGPPLGKMGIVDYFRIPKRAWYWYRNAYRQIPPPAWPEPGVPARLRLEADRVSGVQTDGTDDVRLTVTVLDAAGKPVSNAPPVELRVVSGPGEFPTGPSIAFDANSDIPILDGQAAMEFRAYTAGETHIRALSPGLESAEITIRFVGPVPYEKGKTPPTESRPYVRFSRKGRPNPVQTFGLNNPIFASSAASGHPAGMANDGDSHTWWEPVPGDTTPAVTLDLERAVAISQIRIAFPEPTAYRFRIEISDDRTRWRSLREGNATAVNAASLTVATPSRTIARYLRLTFTPSAQGVPPPRLSEIEITGMLNAQ